MINIRTTKEETIEQLIQRKAGESQDVSKVVAQVLNDIKERGDVALKEYTKKFDQVELTEFKVSDSEFTEGLAEITSEFLTTLEKA